MTKAEYLKHSWSTVVSLLVAWIILYFNPDFRVGIIAATTITGIYSGILLHYKDAVRKWAVHGHDI